MKIVHTSDIHIKEEGDIRWEALLKIVEIVKAEGADLLVIAGDLFDKTASADILRRKVGDILSGNGFKTILIPGNHDYLAFESGIYFGKDVITSKNYQQPLYEEDNFSIWQLPFEPIDEIEVYNRIKLISKNLDNNRINILVYHGELLDAYYTADDYGGEEGRRYMPLRLAMLQGMGFNYVLAGHFHRACDIRAFDDNSYFIYSGSPVSITKREVEKRKVIIFTPGGEPKTLRLDTPYYIEENIYLNPYETESPFNFISSRLKNIDGNAMVILKVEGYIDSKKTGITEKEFFSSIDEHIPSCVVDKYIDVADISSIIDSEIFSEYKSSVDSRDLPQKDKQDLIDLFIRAYINIR